MDRYPSSKQMSVLQNWTPARTPLDRFRQWTKKNYKGLGRRKGLGTWTAGRLFLQGSWCRSVVSWAEPSSWPTAWPSHPHGNHSTAGRTCSYGLADGRKLPFHAL